MLLSFLIKRDNRKRHHRLEDCISSNTDLELLFTISLTFALNETIN